VAPPVPTRPTLDDVAARAGCSPSTVSLVVSGKSAGRVSAAVADRVHQAVAELEYRPHGAARDLATGGSRAVAVVVPDLTNPYYAELVSGLAAGLPDDRSITLIAAGRDEPPAAVLARAAAADPSALVVCSPASGEALRRAVLPARTVVLDAPGIRSSGAHVDVDVEGAGRLAVEHLIERGHRAIAWLGPEWESVTVQRRLQAAEQAARGRARLVRTEVPIIDPDVALTCFRDAWPRLTADGVTAVVCADDLLGFGVLLAARELGLRVPADLAVVGLGNLWPTRVTAPALTSVDLHGRDLGRAAAAALAAWDRTGRRPARRVLPVELVERASTGG